MLTKDQVTHFKSFGFVILRQFFSPEEMRLINDEFEYRSKVASSYKAFDGSERHNIRMMGSDTPFFSALLEDPRFSVAAEQMFGFTSCIYVCIYVYSPHCRLAQCHLHSSTGL